MKKLLPLLLLLVAFSGVNAQVKTQWPGRNCFAGFMTEANAASFRHFILLPDGTLQYFAPGELPKPFGDIDHVIAISAGTFHILALKDDGTVWAWGRNDERQLGNEKLMKNGTSSATPVQVTGIKDAVAISAFGNNSYALLKDGTLRAWGNGNSGMTGDGKQLTAPNTSAQWSARGLPVQVAGIKNAVAIAGPLALLADGTVMTWGDGYWGQLGNGSNETSNVPVVVKGLTDVIAIACREHGAIALKKDGTVWAWGANEKGQLGRKPLGDHDQSNVPAQVPGIANAIAIDAHNVCLALLKDGTVKVWGWGAVGGMGQGRPGTNDVNPIPLKLPGVNNVVAIKSGNGYGMALQKDGTLMGWGANMVSTGIYHQTWMPVKIAQIK